MKKKLCAFSSPIYFILIVTFLSITTHGFTQTCGLVTNSGFENGLTGWTGTAVIVSDVHSGTSAARVGTAQGGLNKSALIPVTAGSQLSFQVWAKISGSPGWCGVGLDFLNSSGTELSEVSRQITSTTYTLQTVTQAIPAGTTNIRIWTWKSGTTGNLFLDDFCVTVPDTQAPSVPVSLASSAITTTGFTLTWAASTDNTGVTAYQVFRNGTSIGNPTGNSLTITGLAAGTTYSMRVRARDAAGNFSAQSTALNVTTSSAPPSSCGQLTNNGFENGLTGWTNSGNSAISTDARTGTGSIVTGPGEGGIRYGTTIPASGGQTVTFTIWGKVSGGPAWAGIGLDYMNASGTEISETVINVTSTNYTQQTVTVAVPTGTANIAIWSWKSGTTGNFFLDDLCLTLSGTADTQAPSVPAALSSSAITATSFNLSWAASTDNVGVTGYEVFRNGLSIGTPSVTSFTVSGLAASTTYTMTVRSRDAVGNWSSQSAPLSVSTSSPPADTQAPTVPSGVASSAITATGFTLSWTASTDNTGVTGYEVYRNGISIGTPAGTSFAITGLAASTTYAMRVRARDAAGNWSAQSPAVNVTTSAAPTTGRINNIGINIYGSGGLDYNNDKPWADAMRSHRQWGNNDVTLDASYWPMQNAQCLVWAGLTTGNNHGTYKLYFNGSATVSSGNATIQNAVYNSTANLTTADLVISSSANSDLYINFTNTKRTAASATNSGVTNVKLMRPVTAGSTQSYPPDRLFTDQFLNAMSRFSTIRYMDWTSSNACGDEIWSDRTKWTDARQNPPPVAGREYGWQGRGASWESVILMANATGKDVWLCLPHKANDTYYQNVALLFKNGNEHTPGLNSNLKLYVEYSNEIWNWAGAFTQTPWAVDAGTAYGHPLNFDGESDAFTLGLRYKSMRTIQISDIFRSVFGDAQMMTRVRPVLEWQQGYNDLTHRQLTFLDRFYNKRDSRSNWATPHPVNYYIWGGGGSTYFNVDGVPDINTIWNSGTFNPATFYDVIRRDALWAKAFGLQYAAYEGNSHPNYNGDEAIVAQANQDPRMKDELKEHHYVFNNLDGDLLCYFNTTGIPFGIEPNNLDNMASPKSVAINELKNEVPKVVNYGSVPPFSRPGNSYDLLVWQSPNISGTGSIEYVANTATYAGGYGFRVNTTGNYTVQVEYSSTVAATLGVELNGNTIQTVSLASTGGAVANTALVNISCATNKLHAIRVVCMSGRVTVRFIKVNPASAARPSQVAESSSEKTIMAFPVPVEAGKEIMLTGLDENRITIQIIDIHGKKIREETRSGIGGTQKLRTAGLVRGVYQVRIVSRKGIVNRKILIQ